MKRRDGKYTVTVILTEKEVSALKLIMEATYRYTMSDCIRAMINEQGKNFLPEPSPVRDNNLARATAANR